jgi:mannan endo-1,4-beta-mannosidase
LTNQWNTCEPTSGAEKYINWYQTGYKQTGDGYPTSFRSFAQQIATRYANDPTIAVWQLVNEPEAKNPDGSCDSTAAQNALRSFADDVTTVMHQADPNHLVDVGGAGGCGMDGAPAYSYVHAGAVDLCEYHDYGLPADALPTNGFNLEKDYIDACHSLGKPIFVGEAGIPGNVQPDGSAPPCSPWPTCPGGPLTVQTLQQRAKFFQAKIVAGNNAGLVGYLIWFKSPYYSSSTDAYAIGNGDPTEAVLPAAMQATPVATVPESRSPALLLGGSAAVAMTLAGGFVVLRRRRRRRVHDRPA